jgi:hypothetical protein
MDAKKIRVELRHGLLRACLLNRSGNAIARTVHYHINAALLLLDFLYAITNGSIVSHVHAKSFELAAAVRQAAARSIDGHSQPGKILTARFANSGRGSGDQDNFSSAA